MTPEERRSLVLKLCKLRRLERLGATPGERAAAAAGFDRVGASQGDLATLREAIDGVIEQLNNGKELVVKEAAPERKPAPTGTADVRFYTGWHGVYGVKSSAHGGFRWSDTL